jgi:hypothetical protein
MGHGPPGPWSTMDRSPLPVGGTHRSLAYARLGALGQRPMVGKGGVVHGEPDRPLTVARSEARVRAMELGGDGRRLAVGARSSVRDEARRTVWGEVR